MREQHDAKRMKFDWQQKTLPLKVKQYVDEIRIPSTNIVTNGK